VRSDNDQVGAGVAHDFKDPVGDLPGLAARHVQPRIEALLFDQIPDLSRDLGLDLVLAKVRDLPGDATADDRLDDVRYV